MGNPDFHTYDFEGDDRWESFKNSLEVIGTEEEVLDKLKRRFWKKFMGEAPPPPTGNSTSNSEPQSSTTGNASTQESAPRQGEPARPSQTSTPPPQQQQQPQQSTSNPTPQKTGMMGAVQMLAGSGGTLFLAHIWVLFNSIIYLVTVEPSAALSCLRRILIAAACVYGFSVYRTHGRPQFNAQWAQRAFYDDNLHYLFFCMIFGFSSTAIGWIIAPIALSSVFYVAGFALNMLARVSSSARSTFGKPFDFILSKQSSGPIWLSQLESGIMFFLVLTIFSANGSMITTFLFGQILRVRYFTNSYSRMVWTAIGQRFGTFINHPACPGFIRTVYSKITNFLTQPPTPRQ